MLWKIFSFMSAACLGAACYFAWSNQKDLTAEREREGYAKANQKAAEQRKKEGDEALVAKKTILTNTQKDLETSKAETVKMAADAQEKEAALAVIKGNLEQVSQQVTAMEKQIEEAGDVEKLIAQIDKYKREKAEAEAAVANQSQRLASSKSQLESVIAQTASLRDAEARGRRGIVDPAFSARISQYFPEWGFGILSKGNSGGVFANSDLEVRRGKNVIAKLKVKNVEQYGAVAELIPGSLVSGEVIRSGDSVVAAAVPQAPAKTPDAAAAPADAAAAPMSTETPGAAPAPAMGSDPFGAAPAAPAAAPAMGSDPFGAAPAPAAAPAAPAMNSDPFGAAPAPVGTPAAPNTADPFAPKP